MHTITLPSYQLQPLNTYLQNHSKVTQNNKLLGEIWEHPIRNQIKYFAKSAQTHQLHPRTPSKESSIYTEFDANGFQTLEEALLALHLPEQPSQMIHDPMGSFWADAINSMPTEGQFLSLISLTSDLAVRYNPLAARV